jgi:hypothetical protein
MVTNINLPVVLSFENEDHVKDFIEAAQEIIPKLKYVHIAGDGYNCIVYTRKDKAFRSIMVAAEAPVAIVDVPVTMDDGTKAYYTMPMDLPSVK